MDYFMITEKSSNRNKIIWAIEPTAKYIENNRMILKYFNLQFFLVEWNKQICQSILNEENPDDLLMHRQILKTNSKRNVWSRLGELKISVETILRIIIEMQVFKNRFYYLPCLISLHRFFYLNIKPVS